MTLADRMGTGSGPRSSSASCSVRVVDSVPAADRVGMRDAIMRQARISQKRAYHASQSSKSCSDPLAGGLSHRAAARQVFKDHRCNRGEARFDRDVSCAGGVGGAWLSSRKHGKKDVAYNPPRERMPPPALCRTAASQARAAKSVNRRPNGTPDRHPKGTPSFYVLTD